MIVPLIGPLRCRVESERACPQTYITALRTGYMRLNLGNGTTRERIATPEMPRHHEAVRQGRQMTCCQLRHVQRPNIQWQAMRGRASLRKSNVFWQCGTSVIRNKAAEFQVAEYNSDRHHSTNVKPGLDVMDVCQVSWLKIIKTSKLFQVRSAS